MKILALDTSTTYGSVALSKEEKIIAEYTLNSNKTHSERLMPIIAQLLKSSELTINEIDAVAVSIGPGSFTGLRIALATAKGICYGQRIPLIPISTLMSLANNVSGGDGFICVLLEAGRKQFYGALYTPSLVELIPPGLFYLDELVKNIPEQAAKLVFVGPNIDKYKKEITSSTRWRTDYQIAPPHLNYPRAASLIDITLKNNKKPVYDYQFMANLQPFYIRRSSAEEKLQN